MVMVLFMLGIGLVAAFYFLPRRHRGAASSTDPGAYTDPGVGFTDPGGGHIDGGSNGSADCSSPSDAGCSDGGGGDGGGGGGGGD